MTAFILIANFSDCVQFADDQCFSFIILQSTILSTSAWTLRGVGSHGLYNRRCFRWIALILFCLTVLGAFSVRVRKRSWHFCKGRDLQPF